MDHLSIPEKTRAPGSYGVIAALVAVVATLTALAWVGAAAYAAEGSFGSPQECIEGRPLEVDAMSWSCSSFDGETWVGTRQSSSSAPSFGGFVVLALLWSGIPLLIASAMASSRGESVGMAIVLTLFLGWIGLAIVYAGQRKTRDVVDGLVDRASTPDRSTGPSRIEAQRGDPEGSGVAQGAPVAARLRELARLRLDELLTDEEYERQRQRILDEI
jgi:hypothetical protein